MRPANSRFSTDTDGDAAHLEEVKVRAAAHTDPQARQFRLGKSTTGRDQVVSCELGKSAVEIDHEWTNARRRLLPVRRRRSKQKHERAT
jgi:hypothetical protein